MLGFFLLLFFKPFPPSNQKMNVLIISNSAYRGYGYSTVATKVAEGLRDLGCNVCYFGLQSIHPPYKENGITFLGIRYDVWGKDILAQYLNAYDIRVLITIFDVWMDSTLYLSEIPKKARVKWICHVTINGSPLSPYLERNIKNADVIVAPSKFALKVLAQAGYEAVYIPHGVDTSIFKPLSKKEIEKTKEQLGVADKNFIALSVMRNKSATQKDFPALFKAWKLFVNRIKKKDAVLLVLSDPYEPEGLRLDLLRSRYGIEDSVKFIWSKPSDDWSKIVPTYENDPMGFAYSANNGFPPEEMAKIYNVCDCHVISSPGESFNLPTLEAMACGKPVIAPDNSSPHYLISESNAGLLAEIARESVMNVLLCDYQLVDIYSLAACIDEMYNFPDKREEFGKNALKYAQYYDWKRIIPLWYELIKIGEPHVNYDTGELGI